MEYREKLKIPFFSNQTKFRRWFYQKDHQIHITVGRLFSLWIFAAKHHKLDEFVNVKLTYRTLQISFIVNLPASVRQPRL